MASVGNLVVNITGNASRLEKALHKGERSIAGFAKSAAAQLTVVGGVAALTGMAAGMVKASMTAEQLKIQMEVLTGSMATGNRLFNDMERFAVRTAFSMEEVAKAGVSLMAANVKAEQILPTMELLGALSMGSAEKLGFLSKAYTDVMNKGKLQAQELRQFSENGVGLLGALQEQYGKTAEEILKMSADGKISFAEVNTALQSLVTGSGRFAGMLERMADSGAGQWESFKEQIVVVARIFGDMLLPIATWTLKSINSGLQTIIDTTKRVTSEVSDTMLGFRVMMGMDDTYLGPVRAMDLLAESAAAAREPLTLTADAIADIEAQAEAAKKAIESQSNAIISLRSEFNGLQPGVQSLRELNAAWVSMIEAFDRGNVTWQAVEQLRKELFAVGMARSGFTEAMQAVTNELRILKGTATEASIELERMASFGVPQEQLDSLRKLWEERDAIIQQNKAIEEAAKQEEALRKKAENEAMRAAEKAAKEAEKPVTPETSRPIESTAAMTRNSSEAFSTLVRAQRSNEDKQIKAIEKQTKAIVDAVTKSSMQMAGGGLALVAEFIP